MDAQFKIHSVQAENITPTNNLLDFDIPAGEVYDFTKSYISVNARMTGSNAQANHANAIFNVGGKFNQGQADTSRYMKSNMLIKNARLNSAMGGKVEELRDVNILRSFLDNVYEPQSVFLGNEYNNLMPIRTYEKFGSVSPLVDLTCESGDSSRYIDKTIKIPLSDILNVGSVQKFDTRRLGKCRLNLELDLGTDAAPKLTADGANFNNAYYGTENNGCLLNITAGGSDVNLTSAVLARGGGTAAKVYDEDFAEHLGFYIGCAVKTTNGKLDGTAGDMAQAFATITDITYAETTGQITLTFSNSLGTIPATKTTADIKLQPSDDNEITTKSITLSQAEIVLHALGSSNIGQVPPQLNYTTYSLERDNGSANTAFKRQYECEPSAINAIVLLRGHSDLIYPNNLPDSTRTAINNELTTDRQVDSYNPIFFNQLNKLALNQGREIKNVIGKNYVKNAPAASVDRGSIANDGSNLSYLVEPLPITNGMKLVEFEINDAGGSQDISVYKEVLASI